MKKESLIDIDLLPKFIEKELSEKAISQLSEFGGHSAEVKLSYYDDNNDLKEFKTVGYIMFRKPEKYGHWGLVIKGNEQQIATLIKVEDICLFELYDQQKRETFQTGNVTNLEIKFTTNDNVCILNANGLKYV